jgi:predicted nucleic acid-binding protein
MEVYPNADRGPLNYEKRIDVLEGHVRSIQLAARGRSSGLTVPLADVLIYACAKLNGLDVAHDDSHFDELAKLEG